ncbi:MAG TPA: hypothetical protein VIY49_25290 [Bryobacteraceae bacterium]
MNTTKIALFAGAAVLIAGGLIMVMKMNTPSSTADGRGAIGVPGPASTDRASDPFTHVASIPATVDPAPIRLEKLKAVDLASKTETTTRPDCKERQFRDPDGKNCDTVKVLETVKAVEAEFSYIGPQAATVDAPTGPIRQSFTVYFHPEEVPATALDSKVKREQMASLFQISTSRPIVQERVIDKQNSHICEGNYVDGNWVPTDSKCKDQVQYITRAVPASYWAVAVDLLHPAVAAR